MRVGESKSFATTLPEGYEVEFWQVRALEAI
jgi:hypothetical protein